MSIVADGHMSHAGDVSMEDASASAADAAGVGGGGAAGGDNVSDGDDDATDAQEDGCSPPLYSKLLILSPEP